MKSPSSDFVKKLCTFVLFICKTTSQFNGLIRLSTSTNQMTPTVTRLKKNKNKKQTTWEKLITCNMVSKLLIISTNFINKVTGFGIVKRTLGQ